MRESTESRFGNSELPNGNKPCWECVPLFVAHEAAGFLETGESLEWKEGLTDLRFDVGGAIKPSTSNKRKEPTCGPSVEMEGSRKSTECNTFEHYFGHDVHAHTFMEVTFSRKRTELEGSRSRCLARLNFCLNSIGVDVK